MHIDGSQNAKGALECSAEIKRGLLEGELKPSGSCPSHLPPPFDSYSIGSFCKCSPYVPELGPPHWLPCLSSGYGERQNLPLRIPLYQFPPLFPAAAFGGHFVLLREGFFFFLTKITSALVRISTCNASHSVGIHENMGCQLWVWKYLEIWG